MTSSPASVLEDDEPGPESGRRPLGPGLSTPLPAAAPLAFDAVYDQYFHHVSRWIRALGGPDADLDDLTQDVFLIVRDKLDAFDGRNLPAWLYRIARNVVSDHRRRAWFRRRVYHSDEELAAVPSLGEEPSEVLRRREAARILEQVLGSLSAPQRAAFVLFEIDGYSGEEIATLEQVPVNTVYTRLHHARKHFFELVARATLERKEGAP